MVEPSIVFKDIRPYVKSRVSICKACSKTIQMEIQATSLKENALSRDCGRYCFPRVSSNYGHIDMPKRLVDSDQNSNRHANTV